MRLKICGITNSDDAKLCSSRNIINAIGIIFTSDSKRQINNIEAKAIIQETNIWTDIIGVFQDQSLDEVLNILKITGIHSVQLHGAADKHYIQSLVSLSPQSLHITKAYRNARSQDIEDMNNIISVRAILLDQPLGQSSASPSWDVDLIRLAHKPVILAGGINSDNIHNIYDKYNKYIKGIDLCSSLEESIGRKSEILLTKFLQTWDMLRSSH